MPLEFFLSGFLLNNLYLPLDIPPLGPLSTSTFSASLFLSRLLACPFLLGALAGLLISGPPSCGSSTFGNLYLPNTLLFFLIAI